METDLETREARRRDADDGEGEIVERDLLADDRGIAREEALPEGIADDGDWLGVRGAVVVVVQCTAENRIDAEDGEVVSRDAHRLDGFDGVAIVARMQPHS